VVLPSLWPERRQSDAPPDSRDSAATTPTPSQGDRDPEGLDIVRDRASPVGKARLLDAPGFYHQLD
jgi:hypothetical protein